MLALSCQVKLIDNIILPWDLFLMEFTLFCCQICFATIYAVLSRNLFCRSLRTFCVETTYDQNVVRGEKMTNIMYGPSSFHYNRCLKYKSCLIKFLDHLLYQTFMIKWHQFLAGKFESIWLSVFYYAGGWLREIYGICWIY